MPRLSIKQTALLRKEEEQRLNNESRKKFWETITDVHMTSRKILELKKKELSSPIADNSSLDEEIAPHFVLLIETCLPFVEAFIKATIQAEMMQQPIDKRDIN